MNENTNVRSFRPAASQELRYEDKRGMDTGHVATFLGGFIAGAATLGVLTLLGAREVAKWVRT